MTSLRIAVVGSGPSGSYCAQLLSERAPREGAGIEVLREAIGIAEGENAPALAAAE